MGRNISSISFVVLCSFLSILYLSKLSFNKPQWIKTNLSPFLQPARRSWTDIQQERKDQIDRVCNKSGYSHPTDINWSQYIYSPEYNLMGCINKKAGSTTYFMTTFAQIWNKEQLNKEQFPEGLK